jgi:hypothetical protein
MNFVVDDGKLETLFKESARDTYDDMLIEPCPSGESSVSTDSNVSNISMTDVLTLNIMSTVGHPTFPHNIPGLIHYVYDKDYAKLALINTTEIISKHEIYEYYKNIFREPDIISIYTPDRTNIDTYIKKHMEKSGLMDKGYVIHGQDSMRNFIDYTSDYNINL